MAYALRGTVESSYFVPGTPSSERFPPFPVADMPFQVHKYVVPGTHFNLYLDLMPPRKKPTQLNAEQYDALERAISDGRKLSVWRRGTEFIVVVDRLRVTGGREALEAHHPTTGDKLTLYIDELEGIEVVR